MQRLHESLREEEYYVKGEMLSPNTIYGRDDTGDLVLYCEGKESLESDKKMSFNIYAEEDMVTKLLCLSTEQFLEDESTYTVRDVRNQETVGSLSRERYGMRKEWTFLSDDNKQIAKFGEESSTWVFINAMNYLPTRYVIKSEENLIATISQSWVPFIDRYKLQIRRNNPQVDRRLLIAMAFLFAASV